jgi:uncharacterized membrane protein YbhN (UPF0104 family)
MAPSRRRRYALSVVIGKQSGGVGPLKWTLLAAGALVLALLLRHFGTRGSVHSLAVLWPAIPVLVLIEAVAKSANALGLMRLLPLGSRRPPFAEILRLTIEAEAVNYLLPTASLGGSALLASGLRRGDVTLSESVIAVTTASTAQSVAQFVLVFAGSALALAATPVPAGLRPAIWAVMALSAVIVCVFLVIQSRGLFVFLSRVLSLLHIKAGYLLERERKIAALDAGLREVMLTRSGDLALATALFGFGWGVSAAELFVVLKMTGAAFSWEQALAIHSLAVFIDSVVFFMPARAGSQEGGKVLAFSAVGLAGSAGLTFGLLRRAREIIWAILGYALLAKRAPAAGPSPVRPPAASPSYFCSTSGSPVAPIVEKLKPFM